MKIRSKLINTFNSSCQIIEVNKTLGIYPIFKNAKSSLERWACDNKLNWVENNNIEKFDIIKIFLRTPKDRIISGIHTYIWQNDLENKIDEVLSKIKNIEVINKHFVPQYYWILHLSKFYKKNLDIQNYLEVLKITPLRRGPWNINGPYNNIPAFVKQEKKWVELNLNIKEKIEKYIPEEYLKLDNELYSKFLNKKINIKEIINHFHALS